MIQSNDADFTIEQVEQYMNRKDFKELVKQCIKHKKFIKEYLKMKWLNIIHQVGETVVVQRSTLTQKKIQQVVKLNKIYCIHGFPDDQQFPLVEIQYYCTRDELHAKIKQQYYDCFGETELFLTQDMDTLFVEAVQQKCKVVTYDEYESLGPQPNVFFSRGEYVKSTQSIEPPLEVWKRSCVCNQPLNPERSYIFCETCQEWFHMECVNVTIEESEKYEKWNCKTCLKNNEQ